MKFSISCLIIAMFFGMTAVSVAQNQNIITIVIDAGHGGKDCGTSHQHIKEKDIVLDIALRVKAYFQVYSQSVNIILTREKDEFIPLHERSDIANKNNAEVFLSLHCNHFSNSSVNGSEVYVMGLHTTEENLKVAKRENASILLEDNYENTYEGYDPNSNEGHIFMNMFQFAYLDESILFSQQLLNSISEETSLKSRTIKQAGFVVLRQSAMPSSLLEIGFLSNPKDAKYLNNSEGRDEVASAIVQALVSYYKLAPNSYSRG